jgi:hypothetical protein
MSQATRPSKQEVAQHLVGRGTLIVHLDPRKPGVDLPAPLKKDPKLVLQLAGKTLPIPVSDLVLNNEGITCTLAFSGNPQRCHIPWPAIQALVGPDNRGVAYPEETVCPKCAGKGTVVCRPCRGKGYTSGYLGMGQDSCTQCKGKGQIACGCGAVAAG